MDHEAPPDEAGRVDAGLALFGIQNCGIWRREVFALCPPTWRGGLGNGRTTRDVWFHWRRPSIASQSRDKAPGIALLPLWEDGKRLFCRTPSQRGCLPLVAVLGNLCHVSGPGNVQPCSYTRRAYGALPSLSGKAVGATGCAALASCRRHHPTQAHRLPSGGPGPSRAGSPS